MGMLYLRGKTWWMKYYRNGKLYYESAHTKSEPEARRKLKSREGQIADHKFPGLNIEKILFDELSRDIVNDYTLNGKKSLERLEYSLKHLSAFFSGCRVSNITTDMILHYVLVRQEKGAENGTINRELSALQRMLTIGSR